MPKLLAHILVYLPFSFRARTAVRRGMLVLALGFGGVGAVAATPSVAFADVPVSCQPNTDGIPGDVNRLLSPPPLTGFSFSCVTSILLGGSGKPTMILNLMDHFKVIALSLLGTFAMLEIVFAGIFDGKKAPASTGKAIALTIAMALVIQNYDVVINGFRQSAIFGSQLVHEAVQNSANTPTDEDLALGTADAGQMADRVVAQYTALQAKADKAKTDSSFALTADESAQLTQLKKYTDLNSCKAMARQAPPRASAQVDRTCQELFNRRHQALATVNSIAGTAIDVLKAPFDLANEILNYSIIKTVSWVVEWLIGAVTLAAGAFLATLFAAACAIGPMCLALVPFRFGKGAGSWWFKNMLALTLMPFVIALATGLYYGGVDQLASYNNNNTAATLTGYLVLLATTVALIKIGWQTLNSFSGGFMAAGGDVLAVAGKAALAVGTAGAGAFIGAGAGAGFMSKAGSATKAMGGEFARQTGGLAGQWSSAMLPRSIGAGDKPMSEHTIARLGAAGGDRLASGAGTVATRAVQAARRTATSLGPTGRGTLDEPGRLASTSTAERVAGLNHAGAALSQTMQAGRDFNTDSKGRVRLTPSGSKSIAAIREAGGAKYRTSAGLSNDEFANQPAIASRLSGSHASPLGKAAIGADGSSERTIAEMLPASVTAPQNANERSNPATHAQRITAMVQTIRQQSGGSWSSVQSQVASVARVAARQAVASSGASYGIDPATAGPTTPSHQRQYTAQAGSHMDMEMRANPGIPQEAAYQRAATRVRQQVPRDSGENADSYTSRVNRYVFMEASEAHEPAGAAS